VHTCQSRWIRSCGWDARSTWTTWSMPARSLDVSACNDSRWSMTGGGGIPTFQHPCSPRLVPGSGCGRRLRHGAGRPTDSPESETTRRPTYSTASKASRRAWSGPCTGGVPEVRHQPLVVPAEGVQNGHGRRASRGRVRRARMRPSIWPPPAAGPPGGHRRCRAWVGWPISWCFVDVIKAVTCKQPSPATFRAPNHRGGAHRRRRVEAPWLHRERRVLRHEYYGELPRRGVGVAIRPGGGRAAAGVARLVGTVGFPHRHFVSFATRRPQHLTTVQLSIPAGPFPDGHPSPAKCTVYGHSLTQQPFTVEDRGTAAPLIAVTTTDRPSLADLSGTRGRSRRFSVRPRNAAGGSEEGRAVTTLSLTTA